jgi:phytanoyl-CoA hydroxylase
MRGLTPQQIDFYKEQGYLILPEFIDPAAFQPLIRELEEVIDTRARQAYAEGRLKELHEDAPFDRRLALLYRSMENPEEIWKPVSSKSMKTAGMFGIIMHPALLDVAEALIGPEILAHPQFNSRAKVPNATYWEVPWHQDLGYLQQEAEETFMVNFWIPMVDAPMESGPLQVIAGSHRWGLIPHEKINGYRGIPESALPPHEVVDCPLKVGQALLIQHKTIHRSTPNTSDRVRWSLDIRYSDPLLPTGRPTVPGFLARSRANPGDVAESHHDWLALFETAARA